MEDRKIPLKDGDNQKFSRNNRKNTKNDSKIQSNIDSKFINNKFPNNQEGDRNNFPYFPNQKFGFHQTRTNGISNIPTENGIVSQERREIYTPPHFNGTQRYNNGNTNGYSNRYMNYGKKNYSNQSTFVKRTNEEKNIPYDNVHHQIDCGRQIDSKTRTNHRNNGNLKIPSNTVERADLNQRDSLIFQLTNGKYECMICVSTTRNDTPIWSCDNCYNLFHVGCIRKWANACQSSASSEPIINNNSNNRRCPVCQNEFSLAGKSLYHCYCGKQINPAVAKRGQLPHSCGNVCDKPPGGKITDDSDELQQCPHSCALLCHPGPCPPCDAVVVRNCHCGRSRISAKCRADSRTLVCGQRCDKLLNCGITEHRCDMDCHSGQCRPCDVVIDQRCGCDRRSQRQAICGSETARELFSCGERCERPLRCGHHSCEAQCHWRDCDDCRWMPQQMPRCWCGKMRIDWRQSCIDPMPSCFGVCGKLIESCGHGCMEICHDGECGPCPLSRDLPCVCGKSMPIAVQCNTDSEIRQSTYQCAKQCGQKLKCGRHRCVERCCDSKDQLHICFLPCGRTLSCKRHRCECNCGHAGNCPPCPNVGFDELHCECGLSTSLPPIACGQLPPACSAPCSRPHPCASVHHHLQRHSCHSQPQCPPCTELTSKFCPGGHRQFDNVPCFRPVVTCGLRCNAPLPDCIHLCARLCHEGPCVVTDNGTVTPTCCQPCGKTDWSACGHPCTTPCHDGDCGLLTSGQCQQSVEIGCKCGLRLSTIACYQSTAYRIDSSELSTIDAYLCGSTDGGVIYLNCGPDCQRAAFISDRMRIISLPTSYVTVQKYYLTYFEEFCRNNFNFVVSIEQIFANLHRQSTTESTNPCLHRFSSISIEKAKFICRLCSTYQLTPTVTYDFQSNIAQVTVKADSGRVVMPTSILSKSVEKKYFKQFKPSF